MPMQMRMPWRKGCFLVLIAAAVVLPAPGRSDDAKPLIEVRCDHVGSLF
jgi:hypothetical protein